MKKIMSFNLRFTLSALAVLGVMGWIGQGAAVAETEAVTTVFKVEGMTCGGCEVGVKMAVKKLDGVNSAMASHQEGTATVTYQSDIVSPQQIIAAIQKLGYEAEIMPSESSSSE